MKPKTKNHSQDEERKKLEREFIKGVEWGREDMKSKVQEETKAKVKKLKEELKNVWCSGFISLSEECFEREWNKAINKIFKETSEVGE